MKFFHTADWHLGKLVQGVNMTEDQRYVLEQFIRAVEEEKPDAVVIAGDLYDRGIPSTDAVNLLDETLKTIVIDLKTPVLAIAGNHDSPSRLNFGSEIMKANGLHIAGQFADRFEPVVLEDDFGKVHFHLVPYADPSIVRTVLEDDEIGTHNEAMKKTIERITEKMDPSARHVFVGHAFVTPHGEAADNTSESERPLAIGGTEYVEAGLFEKFHSTALGHLHLAHYVLNETIRYAGSILKYSISEEHHKKGFYVVHLDGEGRVSVEKRLLKPKHDMRSVEAYMDDLLTHPVNEDYVFVTLLDEEPVLAPMEKVRSVYPNAMHVERKIIVPSDKEEPERDEPARHQMDTFSLFKTFYREMKGSKPGEETLHLFKEVVHEIGQEFHIELNQAGKEAAAAVERQGGEER